MSADIAELFVRDPLKLSEQDIDAVIKYYREKQAQFELGDKTAGSTKKMKAEKPEVKKSALDLLGSLGLVTKPEGDK